MFEKSALLLRRGVRTVCAVGALAMRPETFRRQIEPEAAVQIRLYQTLTELEPLGDAWNALAGDCAFRRWTWLSTWWRHYGGDGQAVNDAERRRGRKLFVLVAFSDAAVQGEVEQPLAILPCYLERSLARGRVLRLLGDGEVCSDHLGLLTGAADSQQVARAMAEWLVGNTAWDLADFSAIDEGDLPTEHLFAALAVGDSHVAQYADGRCWTIDLPGDWEGFLALQSKSHRKQLRQAERRVLDSHRAASHLVIAASDFDAAWATLTDLHQRRRKSLGEPGCFASPAWAAFHRDVARRMLDESGLRLSWLALDGTPVAAEYHLAGAHTTYAYQGGVDPARLDEEPGRLSTIRAIQQAIVEGHAKFDFLRGDESYKAHWRATPITTWRRQATAPRAWPKLRHQTWQGARRVGQLARQAVGLFG